MPTGRSGIGALLMILAMLCFASMDALSKFLVQAYPVVQVMWLRYLCFAGFALLVTRRRGIGRAMRSRRPWLQGGRAALAVVEAGVFVLAFRYLPLAEAHAIGAASPLVVIALSAPLLGERVDLARWAAVLAGFGGVLIILHPGFDTPDWPLLLPLAGAVLWGLYQILVRLCARTDHSDTTLLWSAAGGVVLTGVLAVMEWKTPSAGATLLLVAAGLLGAVAHYALIKALEFAQAAAVQPYSYTLLLWVSVLGFLVFGDVPTLWTLAGGAVVVASGIFAWSVERRGTPVATGQPQSRAAHLP
jgi:drug/metabolite transporter (DMT)-like permease